MNDGTYAGDLTATESWRKLERDGDVSLLDVRTPAEWAYVGLPDTAGLGRQPVLVPWQVFPSMRVNPDFVRQVSETAIDPDRELLIICRSGVRSKSAAIALTAAGFACCYNIAHGFEGDKDGAGHRGTVNGWKVDGLPWIQG